MPQNDEPAGIQPLTNEEHHALEVRWYKGEMLPYVEWLFEFADRQRGEILRLAGPDAGPGQVLATIRQLITQRGSMHMAAEMKAQMREIEKELWYRGEKDPRARAEIKQQWTAKHAAAWRRWRVQEYLFVVDQCGDQLAARVLNPGQAAG
jgi:hypothetical protein